jgi:PAS domain S-box-containing protein
MSNTILGNVGMVPSSFNPASFETAVMVSNIYPLIQTGSPVSINGTSTAVPVKKSSGYLTSGQTSSQLTIQAAKLWQKPNALKNKKWRVENGKRDITSELDPSIISDASRDPIIVLDEEGRIRLWNPAAEKIFGYTGDEALGQDLHMLIAPERYHAKYVEGMGRFQQTGKGRAVGKTLELAAVRKSGDEFPVELSLSAINRDGKWYAVGVVRDITRRKRAEEERLELERKLSIAKRMEAIGVLAGGVAHELNNILGPIVMYPELMRMDIPEGSSLLEDLAQIEMAATRAVDTVRDLQTLASRGRPEMFPTKLSRQVGGLLETVGFDQLKAEYSDVNVEVTTDVDLLNISGSSAHLSTLIMNLVNNAFQAMPDGGELKISTRNEVLEKPIAAYDGVVPAGEYVVLRVSDTGVGIAEEHLGRIFEPFYRRRQTKSSGLGLSAVYGVVGDHNGKIAIKTEVGVGTEFSIYFPATRDEEVRLKEKGSRDYRGTETVLVVDDLEEQRTLASRLLTHLGYTVFTAESGQVAVEYLQANSVDIVMLDMIMEEGFDGLDTYEAILELHPGQRAIVASGYAEGNRIAKVLELGAGQFVRKPYRLQEIGRAIRGELDRK